MVKFIQCNVRSLNTSKSYFEDLCSKNDISILCLTEIWHPDFDGLNVLQKWKWVGVERLEQEGGGAAIILNPNVKYVPRQDLFNENLEAAWCELIVDDISHLLCSVYIKPDDEVSMKLFIQILTRLNHRNIICTGDMNARHPAWYNSDSNKLGDLMHDFLLTSEYQIMNNESPTYQNRIIDLTFVKGCSRKILNWDTFPDVFVRSDQFQFQRIIHTQIPNTEYS